MESDGRGAVGVVLTAFEPGESLAMAVRSVMDQVDAVVVVDDGSTSQAATVALADAAALGADVIRHPTNTGIAQALNTGTAVLARRGCDWVLLLDQDSRLPEGYVADLVAAGRRAQAAGVLVGMVCPGSASSMGGRGRRRPDRDGVVLGGEPITSGLMVPMSVLETLEGHDAGLFIDGVDTDLWLRATRLGLAVVVATDQRLEHQLGRSHQIRAGGLVATATVAADFRYYYQVRNLVLLVAKHGRARPLWALAAIGRQLRHMAIVTLFVPGRTSRLRETTRGLRDGLAGRRGKRPDARLSSGTR